jgi:hypothetical protein
VKATRGRSRQVPPCQHRHNPSGWSPTRTQTTPSCRMTSSTATRVDVRPSSPTPAPRAMSA